MLTLVHKTARINSADNKSQLNLLCTYLELLPCWFLEVEVEEQAAYRSFLEEGLLYYQYILHRFLETPLPRQSLCFLRLTSLNNPKQASLQSLYPLLELQCLFDPGVQNCEEPWTEPSLNSSLPQETNVSIIYYDFNLFTPFLWARKSRFILRALSSIAVDWENVLLRDVTHTDTLNPQKNEPVVEPQIARRDGYGTPGILLLFCTRFPKQNLIFFLVTCSCW